jgi:hypothetical protein
MIVYALRCLSVKEQQVSTRFGLDGRTTRRRLLLHVKISMPGVKLDDYMLSA